MKFPKFILGHNSLIGVHHTDRKKDRLKPSLSTEDLEFLRFAVDIGVDGIVLDNHPVAIETANFLQEESDIAIFPMIPYAQAAVDKASSAGLSGVVKEMASSVIPLTKATIRSLQKISKMSVTQFGAHLATCKYLADYPKRNLGGVCFLHNVVTDLMLGWNSTKGIESFANAIRKNGMIPGFVTLNPSYILEISDIVGKDAWYMTSINSEGIQMGADKEFVESRIFSDPELNVLGMSLLGGGVLKPEEEIPRAFQFPAIKSVVVGTTSKHNLRTLMRIVSSTERVR